MTSETVIADDVFEYLLEKPKDIRKKFIETKKDGLVKYHHTLGAYVRNKYLLWDCKWQPELIDGVDHSPNHPDAISMRVIERVWGMAHAYSGFDT